MKTNKCCTGCKKIEPWIKALSEMRQQPEDFVAFVRFMQDNYSALYSAIMNHGGPRDDTENKSVGNTVKKITELVKRAGEVEKSVNNKLNQIVSFTRPLAHKMKRIEEVDADIRLLHQSLKDEVELAFDKVAGLNTLICKIREIKTLLNKI